MGDRLDYEEFKPYFGLWAEQFKPFIESKEMWDIYQKLKEETQIKKKIIVPSSDVTFRSFTVSDPNKIKSVWYLMDPYPRRYRNRANQATGIPLDNSNSPDGTLQPSLEQFYNALAKDTKQDIERSPNLEYLLEQGILLLNTDLTCELNKTNSHDRLWEPFQKFFLEEIMGRKTSIVYVLAGKVSHRMDRYINPLGNHIFKIEHPAAASHKGTDWDYKDIFSKTDIICKENGSEKTFWNKAEWDYINECPF